MGALIKIIFVLANLLLLALLLPLIFLSEVAEEKAQRRGANSESFDEDADLASIVRAESARFDARGCQPPIQSAQ